jgi:hypothetical protein
MSTDGFPRHFAGIEARAPQGVVPGPQLADVGAEEAVVFVIGMRVNRWRRVRSWLPVVRAMPGMLAELAEHPEDGLLHARTYWSGRVVMVLQYWRSVEDLGRYARSAQRRHAPAWAAFNASAAPGNGDVGIFHETYVVPADSIESRYANTPPVGLAAAYATMPRVGGWRRTRAEERVTTDA